MRRIPACATTGPSSRRRHDVDPDIAGRLARIESMLGALVERESIREWYSTEQFARLVGKAEFTVREYARLGRIHAEKRQSGRGAHPAWVISHAELLRFQRDGLLPLKRLA
jgi:Helix-turn-helix domain